MEWLEPIPDKKGDSKYVFHYRHLAKVLSYFRDINTPFWTEDVERIFPIIVLPIFTNITVNSIRNWRMRCKASCLLFSCLCTCASCLLFLFLCSCASLCFCVTISPSLSLFISRNYNFSSLFLSLLLTNRPTGRQNDQKTDRWSGQQADRWSDQCTDRYNYWPLLEIETETTRLSVASKSRFRCYSFCCRCLSHQVLSSSPADASMLFRVRFRNDPMPMQNSKIMIPCPKKHCVHISTAESLGKGDIMY